MSLFATCALGVSALSAQATLAVDGQTSVIKELGSTLEVTITAPVGEAIALLVDRDPGPTTVFGQSVPLGFTAALGVVPLGLMPPSGSLTLEVPAPHSESAHGERFYFWVVATDPGSANGLAFGNGADVTLVARPELAGNSLTNFPHFEHVLAFNRGSSVELGIDPRFESVDGLTADVYVVESRTATQWQGNTALVDARGAPQTVTFPAGATTIQQNTFTLDTGTLPGPDESPASGDTRIGIGYDVIIDFGQDGNFDDGVDLIDGYDETEAGFYVVRNTVLGGIKTDTDRGPYQVTEIQYIGGSFLGQDTYFPSNIDSLGELPLIVVSHGNGHDYRWYDHIGYHMASFGFVVMSHQNNTVPGSHTAGTTTLTNTDYLLSNLGTIGNGVLDGHIDTHNITWIGHSRGGDGVVRAYDRIFRGVYTPINYTIDDIKLVSSLAPVDFGGFAGGAVILGGANNGSNPHDANYHLWVAEADNDVNGCADAGATHWYRIHERATRKRQSTSLYGVGHGDYHDGGGSSVAAGPFLIGRANTHNIVRGYFLPLVAHHVLGDVPSRDFLWRQWESFRPVGAPTTPNAHVNLLFQDDLESGKYIIDDFQDQSTAAPGLATSGATVTMNVPSFTEGRALDEDNTFSNSAADPFNGFTFDEFVGPGHNRSDSFASVLSFDGGGDYHVTYDLTTATTRPNFWEYGFLSFRAGQQTRHPLTTTVLGDLTFSVSLEDGAGNRSTINIGAYGGGVEEPYQRTGCGSGAGWNSEYETIRIRVTDFRNNGSSVDLADVEKLVFEFGPSFGSTQGRIALDEIELTKN